MATHTHSIRAAKSPPDAVLLFPSGAVRGRNIRQIAGDSTAGEVVNLSEVRRQRAFEAAPAQLHDFEVDLLGSIIGALPTKRRIQVRKEVEAYAKWAPNRDYKAAASKLLARWERL